MSGRTQILVATAPDRTVIEYRTAAGYAFAGLMFRERTGKWEIVVKGFSYESVRSRLRTAANKNSPYLNRPHLAQFFVKTPDRSTLPAAADKYFEDRRGDRKQQFPVISQVFRNGKWDPIPAGLFATKQNIGRLASSGVEFLTLTAYDRNADFQVAELRTKRAKNRRPAAVSQHSTNPRRCCPSIGTSS